MWLSRTLPHLIMSEPADASGKAGAAGGGTSDTPKSLTGTPRVPVIWAQAGHACMPVIWAQAGHACMPVIWAQAGHACMPDEYTGQSDMEAL